MVIKKISQNWYIAKTGKLAFFGRSLAEVLARAFWYVSQKKKACA